MVQYADMNNFSVDNEVYMEEEGQLVAVAATLDTENDQVSTNQGNLPKAKYPSFDVHDPLLLKAGKATACLIIEERRIDDSIKRRFGTAFFVTKTHLLTAGHNVQSSPNAKIESIRLSYAGCKTVDYDTNTVECKVVGSLYNSAGPDSSKTDLAILESPSQDVGTWLTISAKITDLPLGAIVDIIGYPGHMTTAQKEGFQKEGSLKDYNESMKEAEVMLRPKTLTVSRGKIEAIENGLIRYKLSTLCGMSGACLMYKGKIYGVHVGACMDENKGLNQAVSLETDSVRELLKNYVVNELQVPSDYVIVVSPWASGST